MNKNNGSSTSNPKSFGIREIDNMYNYIDYETKKELKNKPENYTHLYGNVLVEKNHKIIVFRGKIDTLISLIIDVQHYFKEINENKLLDYLTEFKKLIHTILYSEVTNKSFEFDTLLGLTESDIRNISHHPKEYFCCDHIFVDYTMPASVIKLNMIRTLVREVELSAYNALKDKRDDLLKILNRMSSIIYILMMIAYTGKDILKDN